MLRNYFFINIVLILIIAFLGLRLYKAITYEKDDPLHITVEKTSPPKTMIAEEVKVIDKESIKVIAEKDIFRSSRTSSLSDAKTNVEMPPANPPKLFGTIMVGTEKTALLKENSGREAKIYRINESISGYRIIDIKADKVLLEAGGRTIEVKLRSNKGGSVPQLTPGITEQRPQAGTARRRVRPSPQRPVRNDTNIQTPASAPIPAPQAPDSDSVPVPDSEDGVTEPSDSLEP